MTISSQSTLSGFLMFNSFPKFFSKICDIEGTLSAVRARCNYLGI